MFIGLEHFDFGYYSAVYSSWPLIGREPAGCWRLVFSVIMRKPGAHERSTEGTASTARLTLGIVEIDGAILGENGSLGLIAM